LRPTSARNARRLVRGSAAPAGAPACGCGSTASIVTASIGGSCASCKRTTPQGQHQPKRQSPLQQSESVPSHDSQFGRQHVSAGPQRLVQQLPLDRHASPTGLHEGVPPLANAVRANKLRTTGAM
jgi:hypothetical protein